MLLVTDGPLSTTSNLLYINILDRCHESRLFAARSPSSTFPTSKLRANLVPVDVFAVLQTAEFVLASTSTSARLCVHIHATWDASFGEWRSDEKAVFRYWGLGPEVPLVHMSRRHREDCGVLVGSIWSLLSWGILKHDGYGVYSGFICWIMLGRESAITSEISQQNRAS